jgi:hypothetical protein
MDSPRDQADLGKMLEYQAIPLFGLSFEFHRVGGHRSSPLTSYAAAPVWRSSER